MSNVKKEELSRNKYPNELKRKIAKDYLSGQYSYGVLAKKNGLKDSSVVKEFVKWYKLQQPVLEPLTLVTEMKEEQEQEQSSKNEEKSPSEQEKRIAELEQKLRMAELKAEAYETMIDLAESQFKIAIRKKSGTQQSKK